MIPWSDAFSMKLRARARIGTQEIAQFENVGEG